MCTHPSGCEFSVCAHTPDIACTGVCVHRALCICACRRHCVCQVYVGVCAPVPLCDCTPGCCTAVCAYPGHCTCARCGTHAFTYAHLDTRVCASGRVCVGAVCVCDSSSHALWAVAVSGRGGSRCRVTAAMAVSPSTPRPNSSTPHRALPWCPGFWKHRRGNAALPGHSRGQVECSR